MATDEGNLRRLAKRISEAANRLGPNQVIPIKFSDGSPAFIGKRGVRVSRGMTEEEILNLLVKVKRREARGRDSILQMILSKGKEVLGLEGPSRSAQKNVLRNMKADREAVQAAISKTKEQAPKVKRRLEDSALGLTREQKLQEAQDIAEGKLKATGF